MRPSRSAEDGCSGAAVVILYNTPSAEAGVWSESEAGVNDEIEAVASALARLGVPFRCTGVRRLSDIPAALEHVGDSVVFNFVQGLDGSASDFNVVPAVCEALGLACSGGDSANLQLTFDKWLTKAQLRAHGIDTPEAVLMSTTFQPAAEALPEPPWIVKPVRADGSEGIGADSIVSTMDAAMRLVRRTQDGCGQPCLVERFIQGSEFGVSLLERGREVLAMPVAEIDFSLFPPARPPIVDYDVKWVPGTIAGHVSPRRIPARIDPALAVRVQETARRAWMATGCRDFARVDFRMDGQGRLYVLEVNANPDVSPRAAYPAALAAAGIAWNDFVGQMLTNTRARRPPSDSV